VNPLPDPRSFLSGESGHVAGRRLAITRTAGDLACNAAARVARIAPRVDKLAADAPARKVLVTGVYRPDSLLPAAVDRLRSQRHAVHFAFGSTAAADPALADETVATDLRGGKFENLNRLLALAPPVGEHDWVVVADDDVGLAPHFLDRFLALCDGLSFDLAQPAQSRRSHAAWRVTRRRAWSIARRTQYVEIGPVTAFSRRAAEVLLPFPELRFGWGLDNHWGAIAQEQGWRLGIVDALPVRHESQPVASAYTHAEAIDEARRFLAGREYVETEEAQRTLAVHRRLP
jgi:hypothetical protein